MNLASLARATTGATGPSVAMVSCACRGRRMFNLNRVLAIGGDSYIRLYPNPGVGVCWGAKRLAVSLKGGLELFKLHPQRGWVRTHAWLSRVHRPAWVKD